MKKLMVGTCSQHDLKSVVNHSYGAENNANGVFALTSSEDAFCHHPTSDTAKDSSSSIIEASAAASDYSKTPLYVAMKPLMVSLKMIGLHYVRPSAESVSKATSVTSSCSMPSPMQVFCFAMVVFYWFYFAIDIVSTVGTNSNINDLPPYIRINSIAALIWLTENVFKATWFVCASHWVSALRKTFICTTQLDEFGGLQTNLTRVRRILTIICMAFWIFFGFYVFVFFYMILGTAAWSNLVPNTFSSDGGTTPSYAMKLLYCVFTLFEFPQWPLLLAFELAVGILISNECKLFCKSFSDKCDANGHFRGCLETERRHFIQLARVIEAADRSLAPYHAASFGCNIVILCLILYNLVYFPILAATLSSFSAYLLWIIAAFVDLCAVCICGTLVTSSMQKMKKKLHLMNLTEAHDQNFAVQVTMFLSQINERVGLTVCQMFTIDQTVVLSLVGMFVTYFMMIAQFATPSSPSPAAASPVSHSFNDSSSTAGGYTTMPS